MYTKMFSFIAEYTICERITYLSDYAVFTKKESKD